MLAAGYLSRGALWFRHLCLLGCAVVPVVIVSLAGASGHIACCHRDCQSQRARGWAARARAATPASRHLHRSELARLRGTYHIPCHGCSSDPGVCKAPCSAPPPLRRCVVPAQTPSSLAQQPPFSVFASIGPQFSSGCSSPPLRLIHTSTARPRRRHRHQALRRLPPRATINVSVIIMWRCHPFRLPLRSTSSTRVCFKGGQRRPRCCLAVEGLLPVLLSLHACCCTSSGALSPLLLQHRTDETALLPVVAHCIPCASGGLRVTQCFSSRRRCPAVVLTAPFDCLRRIGCCRLRHTAACWFAILAAVAVLLAMQLPVGLLRESSGCL